MAVDEKKFAASAWEFWEKESETIERLLCLLCRQWQVDEDGRDAIRAEWAYRLPRVIANFDPSRKVSLRTHVYASLKWYAHKLRANYSAGKWGMLHSSPADAAKRRHADIDLVGDVRVDRRTASTADAPDSVSRLDIEEVRLLLDKLDPYRRALLLLRYVCDQTYEEIGDAIDAGKGVARRHVLEALEYVRSIAPLSIGASEQCLDVMLDLRAGLR